VPEVPARVADRDPDEVAVAVRDLEPAALEADGAVRAALGAGDVTAEGVPQRRRRRARTAHVGSGEEAAQRGLAGLGVDGVVVLHLDPGLRRLVQQRQGQLDDALEHRHEASLSVRPEDLLLGVLVGAVRERRVLVHAEAQEARARFGREHGRAVVHQRGARQTALLEGLPEAVDEGVRRLGEVPLGVAAQARAVVEHAEQDRRHPCAVGEEHRARAMVKVQVPEAVDVRGLVAAHLPALEARLGARGAR